MVVSFLGTGNESFKETGERNWGHWVTAGEGKDWDTHLESVNVPGAVTSATDCFTSPASFSLLLSLHLGSCISHPLYIGILYMLCMALSMIIFSITDYTYCSIFSLKNELL